jgi:hypothetical protein
VRLDLSPHVAAYRLGVNHAPRLGPEAGRRNRDRLAQLGIRRLSIPPREHCFVHHPVYESVCELPNA